METLSLGFRKTTSSHSVRNQVRKTRNQKEIVMKKIPDEEDKKTVMLMENMKRKGRLGSGHWVLTVTPTHKSL